MVAYIDNYKSGVIDGMSVIDVDGFIGRNDTTATVLIASQYHDEIASQLRQKGVRHVVNAHPLVMELIDQQVRRRILAAAVGIAVAVVGGLWVVL